MRHARSSLILACTAVFACGGDEPGTRGAAESASTEEPREVVQGSPAPAVAVVLGTSLTAGMGLSDPLQESWVGRLQARADSAGIPVDVRNAGLSGDTSAGGLRRLQWLLQEQVDVLVVELGANDALRGLDLAALEANLREIISMARAANPDIDVALAGMEAPPNLGPAYTDGFREIFPRLSDEMGTALIPFLLDGVAGVTELNQDDAIHPTPAGHARMAETAWPVLEPLFRRAVQRTADARSEGGSEA